MRKIEITEEQINNIITLYTKERLSTDIISKSLNLPKRRILEILKNANVEIRTSGRQFIGGKNVADKKWRDKNKKYVSEKQKKWVKENLEHRKLYMREYRKRNVDKIRKTKRKYEKNRKSIDPTYKLVSNFRTAIYTVLKENNVKKYSRYFDILGYSVEELIIHLEKQFTDDMSWENYGKWHVDHIQPITSFKFEDTNDDDFKKCWCLNNLQPLWGYENISKSKKIL